VSAELVLYDAIFVGGITVAAVIALALAIAAWVSVFGDARLSGGAKVMWVLAIAFFPIIGSVVYFGVRSDW
jgi:hypothetical protein